MKTFEAVIGTSIIMIAFIALYGPGETLPDIESSNWKQIGISSLQALDSANKLRYDAMNNNTASIEGKLQNYIPANLDYLVLVCETNCSVPTINAERSTSVHYLISGDANNSTLREISLYMWSNE